MNLQEMVEDFADKWGPSRPARYQQFVMELRILLEAYGKAALRHESLPDTEHEHGDPV
ncbi:MAG TPA: hypothetical protein VIX37_11845 [Candidatus Sulfotelmatobacter sp.]